ncbi:hypothetical protein CYLTODRAFT_413464 [Cylindrobasidium torrendii FP15055 ss-10]|uniref:Uncharacterized protein n=1 Tax=Cylindrobasidium torrendii FP15055 ss-10 TaxID=1314674 RepID=A0A0D7B403_9AGAR|nr:hypothetical protein CYLTODRAFT_413464 [Cylindrobasidium torrendii FP15055 ss-10]
MEREDLRHRIVLKDPVTLLHEFKLAFRPVPSTIAVLSELFLSNIRLPFAQRRRFDSMPELHDAPHTLEVRNRLAGSDLPSGLFLKHPITSEITVHPYPHANLPPFHLRTAHPITSSHNAFNFLLYSGGSRFTEKLYQDICECERATDVLERELALTKALSKKRPPPEAKVVPRRKRNAPSEYWGTPAYSTRARRKEEAAGIYRFGPDDDANAKKPSIAAPSRKRKAEPCNQDVPRSKRTKRNLAVS